VTVQNEVLAPPELGTNAPLDEVAAQWSAYIRSGAASDKALAAFEVWLDARPAHAKAFRRIEQAWSDVDLAAVKAILAAEDGLSDTEPFPRKVDVAGRAQTDAYPGSIDDRKASSVSSFQWRRSPSWNRFIPVAIAASLLIMGGAGILMVLRDSRTEFHYATVTGEIQSFVLDDGSTITLGGSSSISGVYSANRRDISLTSGRIHVDVASNPDRPFVVAVANTRVRVVGTAFDVELGSDDVRVAVERGIVRVTPADSDVGAQSLKAGEDLRAALSGQIAEVGAFDPASLQWRTGRLEYIDVPLDDVLAEVNRYREQKIRLADTKLGDLRVSLGVPTSNTDLLLSGLEATLPVRVTRSGIDVVISSAPIAPSLP